MDSAFSSMPAISEKEVNRRLAACYRLLLSLEPRQRSDAQAPELPVDPPAAEQDETTSL